MKRESIFNCPNMYAKGLSVVYLKDLELIKNGLPYSEETKKIRNLSGNYNHYLSFIFSGEKNKLKIIKDDLITLRYKNNDLGEVAYTDDKMDMIQDNFILMANSIQMMESFAELNIRNKNMLKITKDLMKQFFISANLLDIPSDYVAYKLYDYLGKYHIKTPGLLKSLYPYLNPDLIVKEESEAQYHKRFDKEEKLNIPCDNLFYLAAKYNDLETLIYLLDKKNIKSNDILHMGNFNFNKAELISRNIKDGKYSSIEEGIDDFDIDSIMNLDTCVYLAFFNKTKKIDVDYINIAKELFINKGFLFNEENETIIISRAFLDQGLSYFKDWNWNGCNDILIEKLIVCNKFLSGHSEEIRESRLYLMNEKSEDIKEYLNKIKKEEYKKLLIDTVNNLRIRENDFEKVFLKENYNTLFEKIFYPFYKIESLTPDKYKKESSAIYNLIQNKVNDILKDMLKLANREKKEFISKKTELLNTKMEEYVLKPYMYSQNKKSKPRL